MYDAYDIRYVQPMGYNNSVNFIYTIYHTIYYRVKSPITDP